MLRETALVLWRPPLDLGMIAAYRLIRARAEQARVKHVRLMKQIDHSLTKSVEPHEDLIAEMDRLKRELRLLTRGTPLTEALSPTEPQHIFKSDPLFNQRQHDAKTVLLVRAYRQLAMLCHPDRVGGDKQLFEEVKTAYNMRDLNRLTTIYLSIVEGRNLYWQQGEGAYHYAVEAERYQVRMEMLRSQPEFIITRHYQSGQYSMAISFARDYLKGEIVALLNEINYLGKQNGKIRESNDQEVLEIGNQESESEGSRSGDREKEEGQGTDSAGEGALGPCIGQGRCEEEKESTADVQGA